MPTGSSLESAAYRFGVMLIFIDESWQTIKGVQVAALGAVAVRPTAYNRLCTKFFAMKQNVLGATELDEKEIKSGVNLTKSQFKRQAKSGASAKLDAVEEMFDILGELRARAFAVWTTDPGHLKLRSASTTNLEKPYAELLHDLKRMMRQDRPRERGQLYFDQRDHRTDRAIACAVQNYIMRTDYSWRKHFLQVPHFTLSSVSPGLQAADIVAYLAAHQIDPTYRAELSPYWARVQRSSSSTAPPSRDLHSASWHRKGPAEATTP